MPVPDLRLEDYQNPDLTWRKPPVFIGFDSRGMVFSAGEKYFRAYCRAGVSHAWTPPVHVWYCQRIFRSGLRRALGLLPKVLLVEDVICGMMMTSELPPMPGQRCYNCKRELAVWLDRPVSVKRYAVIQGPKWLNGEVNGESYGAWEWTARGMVVGTSG